MVWLAMVVPFVAVAAEAWFVRLYEPDYWYGYLVVTVLAFGWAWLLVMNPARSGGKWIYLGVLVVWYIGWTWWAAAKWSSRPRRRRF